MKLVQAGSWAYQPVKVQVLGSPLPSIQLGFIIGDLAERRRGMPASDPQIIVASSTENVRFQSNGAMQFRPGSGSNPEGNTNAHKPRLARIGFPSSKSRARSVHDSRRALNAVGAVNTFSSIKHAVQDPAGRLPSSGPSIPEAAWFAILLLAALPLALCAAEALR